MIQLVFILIINTVLSYIYKDLRLTSYMTNIISHTFLSLLSMAVYMTSSLKHTDIDKVGRLQIFCGEWLFWYLAYDMVKMFLKVTPDNDKIYYIHHIAAMTLVSILIHGQFLQHYLPVICMFEVSSVPLNVRYLLRYRGVDSVSNEIMYTELVFFITFFLFRWVFGFNKALEAVLMVNGMEHESATTIAMTVAVNAVVLTFFIMHVVWTVGISKKALKYIHRHRKSKKIIGKHR